VVVLSQVFHVAFALRRAIVHSCMCSFACSISTFSSSVYVKFSSAFGSSIFLFQILIPTFLHP